MTLGENYRNFSSGICGRLQRGCLSTNHCTI